MKKLLYLLAVGSILLAVGCARMGTPDGGWYDDTPPYVVDSSPDDKATGVKSKRVTIYFNEFIKLEDAQSKVIVSPPQLEQPDIKANGKRIIVNLKDSLKENTTYTIDFSNAITDNNEDNPLGNFTYSFSTSDHIDTLEVAGYVLNAENLEPIKGIQVGLYANLADSALYSEPMLRNSRTDDRGHFVVKGIAPGSYRVFALQDMDGNYQLSQRGEQVAFDHEIIVPSFKPDIRQDTIWRDSLRIDSLIRVPYTHYLPDDIVLRAFTPLQNERSFLKAERKEANRFQLFYTFGDSILPQIRGLNFDDTNAFVVETSERRDTITYWLRDTTLVNQDTLDVELTYNTFNYPDLSDDSLDVSFASAALQHSVVTDTLTSQIVVAIVRLCT